jgi:hypothetical protein
MDPVVNPAVDPTYNPLMDGAPPIAVPPEVQPTVDQGSHASAADPSPAAPSESQIITEPTYGREYPSLYDTKGTTVIAVFLGISIVTAIQVAIVRMYTSAKSEQIYLTRFVTSLVGLVMGAYIADLLIAGPDTSLLTDEEHTLILSFVKDIALMIFAYYFGTKSGSAKAEDEMGT